MASLRGLFAEVSRLYGYRDSVHRYLSIQNYFSVGSETTDIVEKEMYTFTSKGEKLIPLRPEGQPPLSELMWRQAMLSLSLRLSYITSDPCSGMIDLKPADIDSSITTVLKL